MFNNTILGIIYLIKHKTDDTKKVYVGSTINLKQRISKHRQNYKNEKNKEYNYNLYKYIRANGGFNEYEFIILECYVHNFKHELHYKEDDYIKMYDNNLNTFRAYLTRQEYKKKISERYKKYFNENKEKVYKKNKKYRDKNKEKISKRSKEYYQNNKDIINEQRKEKITCECGSIVRKPHIARHRKSLKHIAYIEQKNNVIL
jgi:hypothetical protein